MAKKEAIPSVPMRVLKIDSCPSLSGRSELTYHVACNAEHEVSFRISKNSSTGQFNANWIPLSVIEKLLGEHPADKPMTSACIHPIFRFKSANSPAFLFAVLKAEGLVKAGQGKDSGYILDDVESFKRAMSALIASDTNLDAASLTNPAPSKRKRKEV